MRRSLGSVLERAGRHAGDGGDVDVAGIADLGEQADVEARQLGGEEPLPFRRSAADRNEENCRGAAQNPKSRAGLSTRIFFRVSGSGGKSIIMFMRSPSLIILPAS